MSLMSLWVSNFKEAAHTHLWKSELGIKRILSSLLDSMKCFEDHELGHQSQNT